MKKLGLIFCLIMLVFNLMPWQLVRAETVAEPEPPAGEAINQDQALDSVPDIKASDPVIVNAASDTPLVMISKVQVGDSLNSAHEFVEIYNSSSETVNLKGWQLQFLTSTHDGGDTPTRVLANFTEDLWVEGFGYYSVAYGDYLAGEVDDSFATNYSGGSLAQAGSVRLVSASGITVDLVGYKSSSTSPKQFETKPAVYGATQIFGRCLNPDLTMRDTDNNYEDFGDYETPNLGQSYACSQTEPEPDTTVNLCENLLVSEIGANVMRQFIEIYNNSAEPVSLLGCRLHVKSGNSWSSYTFGDETLAGMGYLAVYVADNGLKLTASPSSTGGNPVQILASSDAYDPVDEVYYKKQPTNTSYALVDGTWVSTYTVTPGLPNEFAICPSGKIINPSTGNCINNKEDEPLPDCGVGKFRNPETNRCKSYNNLITTLAPCKEGQYRNPLTNRCKKIESDDGLTPCKEGYERNPDTNRCRKIRANNGADYGVETNESADKSAFVGWMAVGVVGLAGLSYVGFEFRQEIGKFVRKLRH
ncbi:lamin tail domain-containing protein [Candidatus Saccharibacteria bacterium]|nr:lamin tail domain-containing protein [Candidatus Saccharibacteria bacterium]